MNPIMSLGLDPIATMESALDELGLEHRKGKKRRKSGKRRKKSSRGKRSRKGGKRRRKSRKGGRSPHIRARFRAGSKSFGCYPKRVRTRGRKTTVRGFCRNTAKQ